MECCARSMFFDIEKPLIMERCARLQLGRFVHTLATEASSWVFQTQIFRRCSRTARACTQLQEQRFQSLRGGSRTHWDFTALAKASILHARPRSLRFTLLLYLSALASAMMLSLQQSTSCFLPTRRLAMHGRACFLRMAAVSRLMRAQPKQCQT